MPVILSYFQREELDTPKANLKSSKIAQCWTSGSDSGSSVHHTISAVPLLWFHSTPAAALSDHPVVLESPKSWGLPAFKTEIAPSPVGSSGISWCKTSDLSMIPAILGSSLQLRLHFHQWPFLASHSAKSQMLSVAPSSYQHQIHAGVSYILPWPASSLRWRLMPLLATASEEILPIFSLDDDGFLLVTASFSVPPNQHQLFQ